MNYKDEEEYLVESIEAIKRDAQLRAEPFVKRLIELRNMRVPQPMILTKEQWNTWRQLNDAP